jgi:DNA-binding MarR family transcriptional regulator
MASAAEPCSDDGTATVERHGELFYALRNAQTTAKSALDQAFGRVGLSTPQFLALNAIASNANVTSAELARRSFVSPQAMIAIIGRLEHAGFIHRSPRANSRCLETTLTEAGGAVLERARCAATAIEAFITARVGARQTRALIEALQRITETCREEDVVVTRTRPWETTAVPAGAAAAAPEARGRS